MDATLYWPFSREYSIWNAAVAALKFWIADCDPQMLSNAIEWVYTAFFCSNSAQHLRNISEEKLFSCFVTTLNDAFKWELALEDGGYKSGSESLSIPTPLPRARCLHHVSASKNLSFWPATPQAHSPQWTDNLSTMCYHLTFEEDDDSSIDSNPLHDCHLTSADKEEEDDEEEHFPTALLNDDVWLEEPVPDRHLCIHEHSQHNLCPYPCPVRISYTSLQIMHQHLSTWTSVTFLTSQMW